MRPSPYAVPLAALVDAARVPQEQQVTEQAASRLEHLPGNPVLWSAGPAGGTAAGGAGGGCGDGDC
jgi:hypothetical protein